VLVLSRKIDETIIIGDNIEVTVVDVKGDQVRIGIKAPKEITIHRKEVYEAIQAENIRAAGMQKPDLEKLGDLLTPPQKKKEEEEKNEE